jgi:hypothetical integral membrane protein (TIGR02206 family)
LGFHAFNSQHLITLTAIAVLCFIAWRAALQKWLGHFLGFLLLGYATVLYFQAAVGGGLTWQDSLPLELCNMVLIACIVSLFKPNQLTSEIAYFWGLGGVLQATLTPDLSAGFPSWPFFLFFWSHGVTLAAIVFLISGQNFKPRKGSILRMMIAVNGYAVIVGAIDIAAGWNYGYLCRKPYGASLYDFLGPWPWYLLSLEGVALVTFIILYLPWAIGRSKAQGGVKAENKIQN